MIEEKQRDLVHNFCIDYAYENGYTLKNYNINEIKEMNENINEQNHSLSISQQDKRESTSDNKTKSLNNNRDPTVMTDPDFKNVAGGFGNNYEDVTGEK